MPYITANDGARIFYKDWGTDGSPVLLSHGWPLNSDAWEAAALFLAEHGHRAIAHDRRGHGRSAQTWHGNEMDTYADDLACLIEQLDLRDLTLVGHSTGGGEVAHYLGRHGSDRVSKLVLVSAVPPLMLRSEDNPEGLPIEVFDAIRMVRSSGTTAGRTSLRASGTRSGCRAWRAGTGAPTSASRPSRPPTSGRTWRRSMSPPWSFMATTTRSCRSRSGVSDRPK
jgi:non-heme chloroperoxidase